MSIGQDTGSSGERGGGCDKVMRASCNAARRTGGSDAPGPSMRGVLGGVSTCTISGRDSSS